MALVAFNLRHVHVADGGGSARLAIAHHEIVIPGLGDITLYFRSVLSCDCCPGLVSNTQLGNLDFDLFYWGRLFVSLLAGAECLNGRGEQEQHG